MIRHLFCLVDSRMQERSRHAHAISYPGDVMTIGIFLACEYGPFGACCRLLERNCLALFGDLLCLQ